ncbi:TPA: isopeptide-forming domain-containing fimbrial protein [Streptococcus agalactiae]|uniref:PI-2a backbone protein n=1 Tax=Streptococcus agalactiae TaxID=1311 RepID=B9UR38_STRAG|nr:isopeptide-forming domain-containing fimbrial protein [Streptococcus agalactiae]ACM07553.1 PI-2a backbone protein [Streptococcus agalactiae]KLK17398.1 cell wall anchor protein [Streptococcus agalactiae]KLL63901.1 cell wall anchor protein [Streptococcus agalactiae]MCH9592795.1 isopeptide-forming domain-containing fimbrial protein [Streptococcus agalactiae]HEN2368108.1 isopeptide-forming domain-containing fimbrial protein [Streptococcus agalactiae]
MKRINKYFAMFSALLLILTSLLSVAPVFAAEMGNITKTVTLHKIVQTSDNLAKPNFPGINGLNGTKYMGQKLTDISGYFGQGSKEIAGAFFAVMNESQTKYITESGTEVESIDAAGVLKGLTTENGITFNTANLKGTYQIVELLDKSNYKNGDKVLADSKAVPVKITLPLYNEEGIIVDAEVYPKNTEEAPQIDKNFAKANKLLNDSDNSAIAGGADYDKYQAEKAKATAEIGQEIPYEVKTKIQKGSKYKNLAWVDTMSNGLTMGNTVNLEASSGSFVEGTDYNVERDDRGFTLKFTDTGLTKLQKEAETHAVEFTLTYSATVNGAAIDDKPESNDIKLQYGNKPGKKVKEIPVTPSNGEITVSKTWDKGSDLENANVVYTLKDGGTAVASVSLTKTTPNGEINLGNGIKFTVTGAFAGKFSGLTDSKTYMISERIAGYGNTITTGAGSAAITNTPDSDNPTPLNPTEPKVVTHGKKFVKTSSTETERLQGAQFVVKDSAGKYLALKSSATISAQTTAYTNAKTALDAKIAAYNKLSADDQKGTKGETAKAEIKTAQDAYNAAFIVARTAYEWVTNKEDANVVKVTSNADGQFEVSGLATGDYKLEETQAPAGYAKLAGDVDFKVGNSSKADDSGNIDYTASSNKKDAQRIENKKVTIPQTGGIGTILFTIIGLSIMLGAVIIMKRRQSEEA